MKDDANDDDNDKDDNDKDDKCDDHADHEHADERDDSVTISTNLKMTRTETTKTIEDRDGKNEQSCM